MRGAVRGGLKRRCRAGRRALRARRFLFSLINFAAPGKSFFGQPSNQLQFRLWSRSSIGARKNFSKGFFGL